MLKQIQQLPQSLLFRFLPTCCWEHNLYNKETGLFHFIMTKPATTAFISTPPLCRCQQEPESNIAWF
jgi:hypothetical protein